MASEIKPVIVRNQQMSSSMKNEESDQVAGYLLLAVLRNNYEVTRFLVEEACIDLTQMTAAPEYEDWSYMQRDGSYRPPNGQFKASILWYACRSSHLDIIKCLLRNGAAPNSASDSCFNSTPLMIACRNGKLDLVKYLVEEANADLGTRDINGETCLFYAVYSKNVLCRVELVEYLLARGVSVNTQNKRGLTALYLAAEEIADGEVAEVLIAAGGKVYNDCHGVSLLTKVAIRGDTNMFRLLFDSAEVSHEERITALEIIAVVLTQGYLGVEENVPSISYIVMYWEISLDKRSLHNVKKKQIRQCPNFIPEFQSTDELDLVSYDLIEFKMQSLWIIERVLAKTDSSRDNSGRELMSRIALFNLYSYFFEPEYVFSQNDVPEEFFNFYSQYFHNFRKMCDLWSFGLSIQLEYLEPYHESTLRNWIGLMSFLKLSQLNGIFSRDAESNRRDLSELAVKLLKMCSFTLGQSRSAEIFRDTDVFMYRTRQTRLNSDGVKKYQHNRDVFLRICVYLIRFLAEHLRPEKGDSDPKWVRVEALIRGLVHKISSCRDMSGKCWQFVFKNDLLRRLPFDLISEFIYEDNVSVKCVDLLLVCGLDANTPTGDISQKQTCLNTLLFTRDIKCKRICDDLLRTLLKHGAHIDSATDLGLTARDKYLKKYRADMNSSGLPRPMLAYTSLQCLCARSIVKHKLAYDGTLLTQKLQQFVSLH